MISLRRRNRGRARVGQAGTAVAAAERRRQRADAEQHGDDQSGSAPAPVVREPGEMAAGEMAGFVRQHADDLVRGLRLHQRAIIHENTVAVGDEGVENAVVDDHDLDVLLFQARSAQDRPAVSRAAVARSRCRGAPADLFLLCATRAHRRQRPARPQWRERSVSVIFCRRARRSSIEQVFNPWRRVGYEICPNKPRNAASLGHHWPDFRDSCYLPATRDDYGLQIGGTAGQIADIDA